MIKETDFRFVSHTHPATATHATLVEFIYRPIILVILLTSCCLYLPASATLMTLLNSSFIKNKLSLFVAVHISSETWLRIVTIKTKNTFPESHSVLSNLRPSCVPVAGTTQAVNCALINTNLEIS